MEARFRRGKNKAVHTHNQHTMAAPDVIRFCVADGYFRVRLVSGDSNGVFKAVLDCDMEDYEAAGSVYGYRMTVAHEPAELAGGDDEKVLIIGDRIAAISVVPKQCEFHLFFESSHALESFIGSVVSIYSAPFGRQQQLLAQHTVAVSDCAPRACCGDSSTCCVCMSPMSVGVRTTKTFDCGHSVHSGCVPPVNYVWEYHFMPDVCCYVAAAAGAPSPVVGEAVPVEAVAAPGGAPRPPAATQQGTWVRDVHCPLCRHKHLFHVPEAPDISAERVSIDANRYYGSMDPIAPMRDEEEAGSSSDDEYTSSSGDEMDEMLNSLYDITSSNAMQLYYMRRHARRVLEELRFMREEMAYLRSLMEDGRRVQSAPEENSAED